MEDSFESGFMFAHYVFETFPTAFTHDDLVARLKEIRDGERTLRPSPLDAIAGIEAEVGRPMPEELRDDVHRWLADREATQKQERRMASRILAMMGEGDMPS